MIYAQLADAPRTIPLAVPYTHSQTALNGIARKPKSYAGGEIIVG